MARQNGTSRSSQSRSSAQARSGGAGSSTGGSKRSAAVSASSQSRGGSSSRGQSGNSGGGGGANSRRSQPKRSINPGRAIAGAGAKVAGTVKENPIPAALIGAGVAWLIVKNSQRLPLPHVPEALSGIAGSARESFSGAAQSTRKALRGGVGTAAESVKSGVGAAAGSVKTGAATVAEYAQTGAAKVGTAAKKGLERSRDAVATTWDEHPLTVGLALLGAGLAAGMMLPAPKGGAITRAAKQLTQRVASTGEELLDSAREFVNSSARSASREAKRQGLTPDQLGRKVKRVADAATP